MLLTSLWRAVYTAETAGSIYDGDCYSELRYYYDMQWHRQDLVRGGGGES